jgi:GT2 family glycosyltransferase
VMNADVALAPDHVELLAARLDADAAIGAAQGKLLQVTPDAFLKGELTSDRVDSAGHLARRTRMMYDIGQGEPDGPRFGEERSVFSACGAALFLRRAMLEDLAPDGEYFDEAFFAYKEDIDLCWRARLLGWDVRYVPAAVGYHVRGWAGTAAPDPRTLPVSVRRHSWKNHYLMMVKNDRPADVLRALPHVAGWEVLRLGHAILRDRALFRTYLELPGLIPEALRKRRDLMRRRRADPAEIRRWFGSERGR